MKQHGTTAPVESELQLDQPALPKRPRTIRPGMRLNIRGRSVTMRGFRQQPVGLLRWLAILGPGMISGAAGNDAGGIATYSQAGAQFGYSLLWVLVLVTLSLAVVQETSARLGAATGRGLLDLIRERFGIGWAALAVSVTLIANGGLIVSEFVGIGAAMELLGISKLLSIPASAALIWLLVVGGSYAQVEKMFLVMSLIFFAYPVAAVLAHPQWGEVARGTVVPTFQGGSNSMLMFVALLGALLTPYQQIFQQSSIVEKRVARRHYGPERTDTYAGAIFSNMMSMCMNIATAATLHVTGKTDISSAADAAQALRPVAGPAAEILFAVGLIGASLLAGAVLPLATAYAISETFGFPKGMNLTPRRAPIFFSLFTALIVIGALVALIPGVPVIQLLVGIQVLNGVLLPILLVFMLLLINDRRLTGNLANSRLFNILGWGTAAMVSIAVLVLLGSQVLALLGI